MAEITSLAREYENSADILLTRIHARNEKLKTIHRCSKEAYQLKRELRVLYNERQEALETARHLKRCYDKESTNDTIH